MRINALKSRFYSFTLLFFILILTLFAACRTPPPADLRVFAPNDTIAYFEINNLAKTLDALTENKAFQENAKSKKDFSALENVQIAVIVTGFETSEKQITEENSILNLQPHFVAVAETHGWEFQTLALVNNQINAFVRERYGGDTMLETSDKNGGREFVWTAKDGRKAFAFVQKSRIYFSNDDAAIEKCLAAGRGETENLTKNESLSRVYSSKPENNLAFGYISPAGITQIANLTGISTAIEATDNGDERSFIARVLPQILQNTTKEVVWTMGKTERGVEDKFLVTLNQEVSSVTKETFGAAAKNDSNVIEFLPADVVSVTVYNLKNPLIAWRSLLLVTAKNTDAVSGKLLLQFSGKLLEPYGVFDAETFLGAIGPDILTAQFDAEGEKTVVVVTVKDAEKVKKSIAAINFKSAPEKQESADIWRSEDETLTAALIQNKLILGDAESVLKCLRAKQLGTNFKNFPASSAVALTYAREENPAEKIIALLGNAAENKKIETSYTAETGFTEKGIERKIVSDFGLLGTILENISGEN